MVWHSGKTESLFLHTSIEERERIKKIIKDTITSKEITFTHNVFNVNKLIKYLNDYESQDNKR